MLLLRVCFRSTGSVFNPITANHCNKWLRVRIDRFLSAGKRFDYTSRNSKAKRSQREILNNQNKNDYDSSLTSAKQLAHPNEFVNSFNNFFRIFEYYVRPPERWISFFQRLPLWMILAWLVSSEETRPFKLIFIRGPSMLPTMAADGSEIWLCSNLIFWKNLGMDTSLRRGDLVGFSHPNHPDHISCKRIIGLSGESVKRYGQYVHLYAMQDPTGWGITFPDAADPEHDWVRADNGWDEKLISSKLISSNKSRDLKLSIAVPKDHVWIEADCPAFGIDSRHFGPIPIEWIRGKVMTRIWPLWQSKPIVNNFSEDKRPHPIPLDEETLLEYNVFLKKMPP